MASKRTPFALLLAGLALFAVVAVLYFTQTGGDAGPAQDAGSAPAFVNPNESRANAGDGAATAAPAAGAERTAAKSGGAELPAAYARALSGIVGRIVEPDGQPAAGQQVELLGGLLEFIALDIDQLLFDPEAFTFQLTQQKQNTNAEGKFHFERVDPRGYFIVGVNLGKGRPQLRLVDQAPMAGQVVDMGDIALDPPLALTGRVVDESGRPVVGARVRVTSLPDVVFQSGLANVQPGMAFLFRTGGRKDSPKIFWRLPKWTDVIFDKLPTPMTTTAADGSFRVEGAPAGPLTLVVDSPSIAAYHKPIPSSKGSEKNLDEVVVTRGEEVPILVVDEKDVPVTNAEVMVGIPSPIAQENVAFLRKPLTCGVNGDAVASAIASQKIVLVARAPGQTDWTVGDLSEASADGVKIQVPAPRSLLVKVQDSAGKPLGATIAIQKGWDLSLLPQLEPPLTVKPDPVEPGKYRVRGLAKGKYVAYARANGFTIGKEKITIDETGEPECTITLEPELLMEVTVLGKEEGKPVPLEMATVFGVPEDKLDSLGFMALGNARTNGQGLARVRALGTGPYRIMATHPAYAMGWVKTELPGPGSATLSLVKGGNLEGQVVRGDQFPEKPMMVVCVPNGEEIPQLPRTTITAFEGKFSFSHLFPGKYKVIVTPRLFGEGLTKLNPMEFMRIATENSEQEFEIRDEEITKILVDVNKGGRKDSPDDGFVRGSAVVNGVSAEGDYVMGMGPEFARPSKVDATGNFDLGRVKPGDYTVSLSRSSGGSAFGGDLASRVVTVKPGESVYVEFNLRTARISGTVRDTGNKPVAGARVRLRQKSTLTGFGGPRILTDESGHFSLSEIASGVYTLTATADDAVSPELELDIAAGSEAKASLVVRPTYELEGTFEAPGIPDNARYAVMSVSPAVKGTDGKDKPSWDVNSATVDVAKRTYRVRRLNPGSYNISLTVFAPVGKRFNYKPVTVDFPTGGAKNVALKFVELPPGEKPAVPDLPFVGR